MATSKAVVSALFALAFLTLIPAAALAQSAITGTVKDTSGAVLPGVTIEAASDVLIEGTKSTVTNEQGQYRLVDLRPGVYTLSFTLPGFNTFKREGLELPAEFTATINVEMKVGVLEETVTVTGESPVVDITSAVHTQVLNRDLLDAIPTGRSIQGLGQTVLGISLNLPDVGGSRGMQQTYMTTHGMTSAQNTVLVDGMMVNGLQSDGSVQSYFNEAMNQEVSYQTSGIGAETSAGGVRLNMIPREGGNKFSGTFFSSWKDGEWQGDNLTQRLTDRGLSAVGKIDRIYDFNAAQGGPIFRDRLWFFGTARLWSVNAPIADTFNDDGSQGIDDQKIKSALVRLTWQMSPKNKLSAYFDEIDKYRGHAMSAGDDPETASVVWNSPAYNTKAVKWTSTMTSRLLVEAGWSSNLEYYTTEYQPGIEKPRGTAEWFATTTRRDIDLVTRDRASDNQATQSPARYAMQASASYVTGSHNLKFGVQRTWGTFRHTRDANGDLEQQYRSNATRIPFSVPNAVLVRNTPYASQETLNGDLGIYGQDQWTFKRLTVNGGLRWEHINAEVPPQERPAGRFAAARHFDGIEDLPNWTDLAPRFGLVYDLFGTGKTAVKFSLNRYNRSRTTGLAEDYNPIRNVTATLPWVDLNGDDIAQGQFGCVFRTPGCEINFASLPANFGVAATAQYDPKTQRTYNIEQGLEVQHELLRRVSVSGFWYRGSFHDLIFRDNQNITLKDWTPLQVFNPITGAPLTIYSFNRSPKPAIANLDTRATDQRQQRYESFGFQVNARFGAGASVFGGANWERSRNVECDEPDNPNLLRFCDETNLEEGFTIPYRPQLKLAGSYTFPWNIQVGATFQSNNGTATSTRDNGGISWLLSSSTRYPATCPKCPNGTPPWAPGQVVAPTLNGTASSSNLQVRLTPFNTEFHDRINQLDLRFSRAFTTGMFRLQPTLEIFNVFNSDAIVTYRSANYGTVSYRQPSVVLQGRIVGIGLQARW